VTCGPTGAVVTVETVETGRSRMAHCGSHSGDSKVTDGEEAIAVNSGGDGGGRRQLRRRGRRWTAVDERDWILGGEGATVET